MTEHFKAASVTALPPDVEKTLEQARRAFQPVILATGVFDLLHEEHIKFLQNAKALGGVLVVGLESDVRVKQMKGENRPINDEFSRALKIQELQIADAVFILPDQFSQVEDRRQLIHHIKPKYLAVSSHSDHLDAKRQLLAEVGGEVKIVHQHNPTVSTTQLLAQKT